MRHCYVCNRCGVPITNALCDQCHKDRKERPVKQQIIEHVAALIFMTGLTAYVAMYLK